MVEKIARRYRRILLAILSLSFLLRVVLIFSGGQYFWPDENRYQRSSAAAKALWSGDICGAMSALHYADHFLFKVIGVIPASIQILLGPSPKIPALFFSLFSIVSLLLIWGIMRRTGENERVSLFAVALFALCSTFLYYSRHLLPYDTAMAFGLFSLFAGLRKPTRTVDSILCGFFSALAFLTYNGYWVLAGFAIIIHTLRPPRDECIRRGFISGVSFAAPLIAILTGSAMEGGHLLQQFLTFSGTVTQGSFSEGWSLPFMFFWHAEHFLILLWAVALICSLREYFLGSRKEAMILGLTAIFFIYGTLVIFSVVLEKFVVYGRLARQLVPFCCILTALFIERLWTSVQEKSIVVVILIMAVFQAAVNFQQPFTQVFPDEFNRLAFKASVLTKASEYEILNAYLIYPEPLPTKEFGRTIIQKRHPLQFLPYQYEGYTPDQRSKLRSSDINMRLVLKLKQ